jgi:hypothetical protein
MSKPRTLKTQTQTPRIRWPAICNFTELVRRVTRMESLNSAKRLVWIPERPSTLAMTFYAPGADIVIKGNPDFIGTMVCKSFYGNGNVSWHYDRALNTVGEILDYRIASYVEDTR